MIPSDDRGQEVPADLERATPHASGLTQKLLAYAGRAHVERRQLDVNDLVAEVLGMLGAHIPSAVSLSIVLSHAGPIIDGDETQLRQVLLSLVSNAVASIGNGRGCVELPVSRDTFDAAALADCRLGAARYPGPFAVISVRDTGVGMSADVQERMFDPFFSTKVPGGGPGLAATLDIVNGHDGAGRHVRRSEARFLQKPYSARELLDALRDTLARSPRTWHTAGAIASRS